MRTGNGESCNESGERKAAPNTLVTMPPDFVGDAIG
jgi:hypothetical protein